MLTFLPKHWPSESSAELDSIRSNLAVAKTNWKTQEISDYDIDVSIYIHLMPCFTGFDEESTTLNIRQGQLVIIEEVQRLEQGCHISELLPPLAFETVSKKLEQANPNEDYMTITFDPEYGFITEYFLASNNRASDLFVKYTFSNFQIVEK